MFVGIKKAVDSIKRGYLWKAVKNQEVPDGITEVIKNVCDAF